MPSSSPPPAPIAEATRARIREGLAAMVADPTYPCVGAKSVFARDNVRLVTLPRMADPWATAELYEELAAFSAAHPVAETVGAEAQLASFVAAFRGPVPATESVQADRLRDPDRDGLITVCAF